MRSAPEPLSRRAALRWLGTTAVVAAGSTLLAACGSPAPTAQGKSPAGGAPGKQPVTNPIAPMFEMAGGNAPHLLAWGPQTDQVSLTMRGDDIWNTADTFTYYCTKVAGDKPQSWTIKVDSLDPTSDWAKAGIMARNSLDPGSMHVFLCITSQHGATLQHRDQTDKSETGNDYLSGTNSDTAPIYLKLAVDGQYNWTAWTSPDGQNWNQKTAASTNPIKLNPSYLVGLATTSHNSMTHGYAVFQDWTGPQLGSVYAVGTDDALLKSGTTSSASA